MTAHVDLMRQVEVCVARRLAMDDSDQAGNLDTYAEASRVHGQNLRLEVAVRGPIDACTGMLVNFDDLKSWLGSQVLVHLDGRRVDLDIPHFRVHPATIENLARWIRRQLEAASALPAGAVLRRVRVRLNESTYVDDLGGSVMEFTRRYHFSASHRLWSESLSEAENRRIFGKCANDNGHGHNYMLEVTIAGEPDSRTGFVAPGRSIDAFVEERVLSTLDHSYLNVDHASLFGTLVPTAENICVVIWGLLSRDGGGLPLKRLRLEETRDCFVEYHGPRSRN